MCTTTIPTPGADLAGAALWVAPTGPTTFERQDRFAAFVAHELRTLIALQRALVELALTDPHANTAALRAMAEEALASCEQQQRLIEALLDLTLNRRALNRQLPVDIAATTKRALQGNELGELDSFVALEPAVACGDPILLERLAANLISNAIRHNIPHGRIEVATRTDAARALLSVANTGPVIPAGDLTRLFQPFAQLRSHPKTGGDGIGLGLAIVKSIADAHNANVTAHARAGGGLKIELRFPASMSTLYAPSDQGDGADA